MHELFYPTAYKLNNSTDVKLLARPNLLPPFEDILSYALQRKKFQAARWAIDKGACQPHLLEEALNLAIEMRDIDFRDYLVADKRVPVSFDVLTVAGVPFDIPLSSLGNPVFIISLSVLFKCRSVIFSLESQLCRSAKRQ